MLSAGLLVLSGAAFYGAATAAAIAVAAIGDWVISAAMAVFAAIVGAAGALLLLLSHASNRWRDRRRRAGLMLVVVGLLPLPAIVGFALVLLDPTALRAIVPHGGTTLATLSAVPLWRVAAGAAVPAALIAWGVRSIRSEPAEPRMPLAGFSASADGA